MSLKYLGNYPPCEAGFLYLQQQALNQFMQSPQPIAATGQQLLKEAKALSVSICGDYAALNRWMYCAKKRRMKWVPALNYAIARLKEELQAQSGPST